jgi:sugar lactone lactonase YvrE
VLEYNTPFIKTPVAGSGDTVADRVFGQVGFSAGFCNRLIGSPRAFTLCLPHGVAVDSLGHLYIGDFGNDRVLECDKPLSNGPMLCSGPGRCANRVFGQGGDFTMFTINNGGESANSLWNPWGVALDKSNRLYVADFSNHRVLEYDTPLTSPMANRVFGQSSFGGPTNCNQGTGQPSSATLCYPRWLTVDGQGNLYVSDTNNNRVLKYVNPLTNAIADLVLGQGGPFEFNLNNCNLGPNGLCVPEGIAADASNNFYVADMSNYRVLEYYVP